MTKAFFLRNAAIVFACLAVTMMTACGGGSSNKSTAQSGDSEKTAAKSGVDRKTQVKSINASNWQAVVKSVWDIDVPVPDGWTVNDAMSLPGINVLIKFTPGDKSEFASFGTTVFGLTKAVSKKQMEANTGNTAVNSLDDAKEGSSVAAWTYFPADANLSDGYRIARAMVSLENDGNIQLQLY